jgi:outer membrane protein assembly factor BamB
MPSTRRTILAAALATAAGCTRAPTDGAPGDGGGTATTSERPGTPNGGSTPAPDAPPYTHWTYETSPDALGTLSIAPGAGGPAVYAGSDVPGEPGETPAGDPDPALHAISLPAGTEQWRLPLPNPVQTAPVVGGHDGPDRLYLSTGERSLHGRGWELHAIDYDRGERAWGFDIDDRRFLYPLAASDDGVFVGRRDDQIQEHGEYVYGVAAGDGEERWRVEHGDVETGVNAARRGRLFVRSPRRLRALEPGTGEERWRFEGDERLDGPTYDTRAERVFLGHDDAVRALAHDDGSEVWRREFGFRVSTVTSPRAAMDETVFVAGADGRLLALSPLDGETRWTLELGDEPLYPTVRRTSETMFVGGNGVHALDPVSGERRWAYTPDVEDRVVVHASTGVFASVNGEFVAAIDPETGEERWRFEPDGPFAGPATAGEVAVVGVGGTVYALDGSGEA